MAVSNFNGNSMVRKVPIGALQPGNKDSVVVGLVIGRVDSRLVIMRKDGTERYVTTFTIRDSPADIINFTVWSSQEEAEEFDAHYHIGTVIEIIRPRISHRELNSVNEMHLPSVTSPLILGNIEGKTVTTLYHGNSTAFEYLKRIPSKASAGYFSINDVSASSRLVGKYVDLCVVVRSVGLVKTFQGKDGQSKHVREVKIFDMTSTSLTLKIWDTQIMRMSDDWIPRTTVLFLADIRISNDTWRGCNIASTTSRTIITENPDIDEANALMRIADQVDFSSHTRLDHLAANVNFNSITQVDNVHSLREMCQRVYADKDCLYLTMVYGYISRMDIDQDEDPVYALCSSCGKSASLEGEVFTCNNMDCMDFRTDIEAKIVYQYNIKLDITDETGTIIGCRMRNEFAERCFQVPCSEFINFTPSTKTSYKWTIFLKPMKLCLGILLPTSERREPTFSVITGEPVDLEELATKMPSPPLL